MTMRTLRQQHAAAERAANRQHDLHWTARERSIELAEKRGQTACSWAARLVGEEADATSGALIDAAYAVESATSGAIYTVLYRARTDDAECGCRAAQHGAACWHRGLAIMKGRALAAQYTPAGRAAAAAEWRDHLRAEANELALAPSL